ncbi:hypothetical protein LguiA_027718 [Lonicera macranthoides]
MVHPLSDPSDTSCAHQVLDHLKTPLNRSHTCAPKPSPSYYYYLPPLHHYFSRSDHHLPRHHS